MNTHRTTTTAATTTAIATAVIIGISGPWATPARATTHAEAGSPTTSHARDGAGSDIDGIVAIRKSQFARDAVDTAAERAGRDAAARSAAIERAYVDSIVGCVPGERRPN